MRLTAGLIAVGIAGTAAIGTAAPTEALLPSTIDYPGATATVARGINDTGQIVGTYFCASVCTNPITLEVSSAGGHGFLFDTGAYKRIDVPAPGATSTVPRGISVQGTIVGHYNVPVTIANPDGTTRTAIVTHGFMYFTVDHMWLYPIDVPQELFDHPASPERNTLLMRLSPQGDLIGCFHEDNQTMTTMHGWLWSNGSWIVLATPHDAGDTTSHDPDTMNNGIAANGLMTGIYTSEGVSYIADEAGIVSTFTFDGNLFTLAWDMNARGDVVGVHGDNPAGTVGAPVHPRGFLRNARGEFRDLMVQGAIVTQLFGINNARDIVGSYTDAVKVTHGFVAHLEDRGSR